MRRLSWTLLAVLAVGSSLRIGTDAQDVFPNIMAALRPLGFQTLSRLVFSAGLQDLFSDPTLSVTLFAPTDNAFPNTLNLFNGAVITDFQNLNMVRNLLLYHVVPRAQGETVLNFTGPVTLDTQLTSNTTLNLTTTTDISVIKAAAPAGNQGPNLWYLGATSPGVILNTSAPSYAAGAARIYPVDLLLVPPSTEVLLGKDPIPLNILDAVTSLNRSISLFGSMINADPELRSFLGFRNNLFTVLAPSDAGVRSGLAALGTDLNTFLGSQDARDIVLAHVVTTYPIRLADFKSGEFNYTTAMRKPDGTFETITLRAPGGSSTAVQTKGQANIEYSRVSTFNIRAGKSVLHIIDGMLLPARFAALSGSDTKSPVPAPVVPSVLLIPSDPVSVPTPSPTPTPPAGTTYTSVYNAIDTLGFSSLKITVGVANMTQFLSNPDLQAIVFISDDEAFAKTLRDFPKAVSFATNPRAARAVLYNNIFPTSQPNQALSVVDGQALPTLLATSPDVIPANTSNYVNFRVLPDGTLYAGGVPPGSIVDLNKYVVAGKSRVYITSNLLVPVSRTLVATANNASALSIADAVSQNNATLSVLAQLIAADAELAAIVNNPDSQITVFAPTNDALTKALAALNTTLDSFKGSALAQRVLRNHIIPTRPWFSYYLPVGSTPNVPTASPGDVVTISSTNNPGALDPVVQVQGGGNSGPILVIAKDVPAGKSIVHVINDVVLPYSGPPLINVQRRQAGSMHTAPVWFVSLLAGAATLFALRMC